MFDKMLQKLLNTIMHIIKISENQNKKNIYVCITRALQNRLNKDVGQN